MFLIWLISHAQASNLVVQNTWTVLDGVHPCLKRQVFYWCQNMFRRGCCCREQMADCSIILALGMWNLLS